MKNKLKDEMLKAIFIQTGGRPENPKIAEICAQIAVNNIAVQHDVSKCDCGNIDDINPYYDIDEDIFRCDKCDKHFC